MTKKRRFKFEVERNVALCYVRQSFTRTGEPDDQNGPERQRANIQAVCDRNKWIPEWYEDVGGHKSARTEKGRPQWIALKKRLNDPDVGALVANDLARLHRKGWRIGDLLEFLNENNVNLVLAAPGRDIDISSTKGKMFVQFGAIVDEFYAEDISQRAKDSILYRKSLGKTVGIPPFGTVRNEEGFLIPSTEGAWLLPDGKFIAGTPDATPEEMAVWRGYYEAAEYALTLFASGEYGLEKLAYQLNDEGWAFRDRNGKPRMFSRDDVRRIVANWPAYGGIFLNERCKDHAGYEQEDLDEVVFQEDQAVFPTKLLRAVAQVRRDRSQKPVDHGVKKQSFPYPLSGITYCAHCERLAEEQDNPKLRSKLSGKGAAHTSRDIPRYRHKPGVRCGTKARSVQGASKTCQAACGRE